jgi:hypothetical protein
MTEEVKNLDGIKFRLECLRDQYKSVNTWTQRRKFDRFKDKKVFVTAQKTRTFWGQLKWMHYETIGLLEDIIRFLEAFEEGAEL